MDQLSTSRLTLDEISKRKKDIEKEIKKQKDIIQEKTKELFSPQPEESGINSFMQSFNKGLALYDGVMTGIKIMKKVRRLFTRKERNKK